MCFLPFCIKKTQVYVSDNDTNAILIGNEENIVGIIGSLHKVEYVLWYFSWRNLHYALCLLIFLH